MFGYIRMDRSQLSDKDCEDYKSIYCGLCKQIGRDYSVFARFILSYDCTFYAMLVMALAPRSPDQCSGRCRFNPLKKCSYATTDTRALSLAAALSVCSAYYKLIDDIHDSVWYKRLLCRMLRPIFARWHRKASRRFPQIEQSVSRMMQMQAKAESTADCTIDYAAEPTAVMLSAVCADIVNHIEVQDRATTTRVLGSFGYFLGRWIYLMDAADDYDKDFKRHGFNPFLIADISRAKLYDHILPTLNHSLSEALLSYGLLSVHRYQTIIENVLYCACPKQQNIVLSRYKTGEDDEKPV